MHLALCPQTGEVLSNRTFWGLLCQVLCGTIQAHRVCKRLVPKPRGSPAVRGFVLILAFQLKAGKRLEVDRRLERASWKANRAHGGETPVSPIICSERLIHVSSLSGAFGKETAMFISYDAKQHRCPATDIPPCLASHVKDASPDVIHLLARDQLPSLLARDSSRSLPPQPYFATMYHWRNIIFQLYR
jgi:hypothetical protein